MIFKSRFAIIKESIKEGNKMSPIPPISHHDYATINKNIFDQGLDEMNQIHEDGKKINQEEGLENK